MLFLIFTISYLVTSLINPGIPERNYYSQNFLKNNPDLPSETVVKCSRCNIIVPKYLNMTHCTKCDVCVKKYDHHCIWIGKCVGKKNMFYFQLFITNVILVYVYIIFFVIYEFINNKD